ncbi:MAG: ABC-type transport auxiliary lipoprotein family protein [Bacteroidales bacterium]
MKQAILYSLMLLFLLSGCWSGEQVVQRYFLLEPVEESQLDWPEGVFTISGSCHIEDVSIAPVYNTHQIAVRESSHQIRYFSFNEWAVRPEIQLTDMLLDFFDQNQVFQDVEHGRPLVQADYLLQTAVSHLELDHQDQVFKARLHLEMQLVDMTTENIVFRHQAERLQEIPEKDLNQFAAVISRFLEEELMAFSLAGMREIGPKR